MGEVRLGARMSRLVQHDTGLGRRSAPIVERQKSDNNTPEMQPEASLRT